MVGRAGRRAGPQTLGASESEVAGRHSLAPQRETRVMGHETLLTVEPNRELARGKFDSPGAMGKS